MKQRLAFEASRCTLAGQPLSMTIIDGHHTFKFAAATIDAAHHFCDKAPRGQARAADIQRFSFR
jgi:hypothetical protein